MKNICVPIDMRRLTRDKSMSNAWGGDMEKKEIQYTRLLRLRILFQEYFIWSSMKTIQMIQGLMGLMRYAPHCPEGWVQEEGIHRW